MSVAEICTIAPFGCSTSPSSLISLSFVFAWNAGNLVEPCKEVVKNPL